MEKERIEELMIKLKTIEGKELRYGKLCEALGEEPKKGTGKRNKFFNELAVCCQLAYNPNTKKYVVEEVYDEAIEVLELLSSKSKYQLLFELAVYEACINNNGEPLYLSGMDTLKLFQEVNDNFSYACNRDIINKIDEYYEYGYMPEMGVAVYRILNEWTKRRLKDMAGRHKIMISDAYRLHKEIHWNGNVHHIYTNVTSGSELEKTCMELYNKAIERKMPDNWGKSEKGKYWVRSDVWQSFQSEVRRLVANHFNNEFDDLKPIIKITCASSEWLQEKVMALSKELNAIKAINKEACRKALESKTELLDYITQAQRKEFVEINMKPNPAINFKTMLEEYNNVKNKNNRDKEE